MSTGYALKIKSVKLPCLQTKTPHISLSARKNNKETRFLNRQAKSARREKHKDRSQSTSKICARTLDRILLEYSNIVKRKQILKQTRYIRGRNNLYRFCNVLAKGSLSCVHKAINVNNNSCLAIKVVARKDLGTPKQKEHLCREIKTLRKVQHQNIVEFIEIIEENDIVYMVMECFNTDLLRVIMLKGRLDLSTCTSYLKQLIQALQYLHNLGIAHRDLKAENLLIRGNLLKLADFGYSVDLNVAGTLSLNPSEKKSQSLIYSFTRCGSPHYIAPEIILGAPYDATRSDIWSVGVIFYTMCCGCLPFHNSNETLLYEAIIRVDYQLPKFLPYLVIDLVMQLLRVKPRDRLYFPNIFQHMLFRNKSLV